MIVLVKKKNANFNVISNWNYSRKLHFAAML